MTITQETTAACPEDSANAAITSTVATITPSSRDEQENDPAVADLEQPAVEDDNRSNNNSDLHDDDEDDDDDLTIIGLDQDQDDDADHHRAAALAWMEQNGPEMEERRRNVLLRELHRVQKASFIHFILLCLIPTALLCIVVATVLADEEPCGSNVTTCRQEARTFVNAFTTRCICDAVNANKGG